MAVVSHLLRFEMRDAVNRNRRLRGQVVHVLEVKRSVRVCVKFCDTSQYACEVLKSVADFRWRKMASKFSSEVIWTL